MSRVIRVLHVDDDPDFGELTASFLEREHDQFTVTSATSAREGLDRLGEGTYDCIVSDYDMPERNGIEFLEAVRDEYPELPFVLFTGKGSEEIASEAISAGVTDYLQKGGGTDQYTVLANRITNAVEHYRSRRQVELSEQRLRKIVDSLPLFLYVVDEEGTYRLANEVLADFHRSTVEEIEGSNVEDVLDEPQAEHFRESLADVLESDTELRTPEVDVPDPTGETHVFEPRLLPYDLIDTDQRAVLGISVDVTERREREQTLEETRERMRLALDHTDAVIFEIDLDTGEVVRHGSFETFFDLPPEEVPTWRDLLDVAVHPEDADEFRRFHEQLIDGERDGGTIEYRTTPDDGEHRWLRATVQVKEATADGTRRAVGISRDVTAQKEREVELTRTNALLSTLFDTLPVGVIAEDASRTILAANQRVVDLFDGPDEGEDLAGVDAESLTEEVGSLVDEPAGFLDRLDDVRRSEEPVRDEQCRLRDGRTFEWSHQPIELADGVGHLWMLQDVTDRRERETRLEALNDTTPALMAATSPEAVANVGVEAAREVLGLEANAIHLFDEERSALVPAAVSDPLTDLVGEPPTFEGGDSIAWRSYESGEAIAIDDVHDDPDVYDPDTPVTSELCLPIEDHGILIAGSSEPAAFGQQDVVLGELLAGNLATALEQVERTEELRARERELSRQNERLEEFAGVISHDLRSPLDVAEAKLELARQGEDGQLEDVAHALDRMGDLIEDLLTFAREGKRVSEPQATDLAELSRSCWRHVATADATLQVETEATIMADRGRLAQLVENLVRNAVEHGGDDVTVTVGTLDGGFYLEDDGPGIPAGEHEAIFKSGYSTAPDGTGFGLSIVQAIAVAHGWDVRATSGTDGGLRFEVTGVDRAE